MRVKGTELKRLREMAGLSVIEISDLSGTPRSTWYDWEKTNTAPMVVLMFVRRLLECKKLEGQLAAQKEELENTIRENEIRLAAANRSCPTKTQKFWHLCQKDLP